jgi:hypothetical protein
MMADDTVYRVCWAEPDPAPERPRAAKARKAVRDKEPEPEEPAAE